MQKIKFQIKGMHCNSCATLIEERLKSQTGIIKVKVNYDSQKAVVIYDEQKINESEIIQIIEKSGDYKIEKIEENNGKEGQENKREEMIKDQPGPNPYLVPLSILIAGLIISGAIFYKGKSIDVSLDKNNSPQAKIDQRSNQPSPIEAPRIVQFNISQGDHIRGNFNAPITLVEFSSFECPFSARFQPTIKQILADYPNQVRYVYKHFPLPFQPNSFKASEASECADEQGKFWEMHDEIYKAQPTSLSTEKFKEIARNLKFDTNKFNNCLDSGKYAQKVQADYDEGLQKGVQGTPATFVNGQLVSGALPYDAFKQIIDNLLNQ